ncbi:hypothetical protein H1C71_030908, partial [Ictidomys tridecemlineatus]
QNIICLRAQFKAQFTPSFERFASCLASLPTFRSKSEGREFSAWHPYNLSLIDILHSILKMTCERESVGTTCVPLWSPLISDTILTFIKVVLLELPKATEE